MKTAINEQRLTISLRAEQYDRLAQLAAEEHTSIAFQIRKELDARKAKTKREKGR